MFCLEYIVQNLVGNIIIFLFWGIESTESYLAKKGIIIPYTKTIFSMSN